MLHRIELEANRKNTDSAGNNSRFLTDRLERAGKTAPRFHGTSRPIPVEREATHRAISLAELVDVPVLIVHVSGREAIEQIRWAQARGNKVYAETCPQYLFLSEEDLDKPGLEGAKCMCSPPPASACHTFSWFALSRGGGLHMHLAPASPGLSRSSSDRNRYCGQVSA